MVKIISLLPVNYIKIMRHIINISIILFLFQTSAYGQQCLVVRVKSGDQLLVQCGDEKLQIRLYGIDAPGKNQPFGIEAKEYVKQAVLGKNVDVNIYATDRRGRPLALVTFGGFLLNEMLLHNGLAWFSKHLCDASFCRDFKAIAEQSREQQIGLWQDNNPISPWDYKVMRRNPPPAGSQIKDKRE